MSALQQLDSSWQQWVETNLAKGVPTQNIAVTLFDKGWADAAFELMQLKAGRLPIPYIDVKHNIIKLSDRTVSLAFACSKPFVVVIDDFLSADECQTLIQLADSKLTTSRVVNPDDGTFVQHPARTSSSAGFQRGEAEINQVIENRIAELLNWPVVHGEGLQVLRYEDGGEYRPHYDFFDASENSAEVVMKQGGQRVGTFLMYLSAVEEGGATRFPKMDFEVRPKVGRALYFANIKINGETDELTLHAGIPVTKGIKYLSTKWLRERPYV